jgi:hypothetical protein
VSKQTVDARIQAGRHNVFHPGTPSPVIAVEPILVAMITTAYELDAPMNVKQCKDAMNEMLRGTRLEAEIIAQRKKEGTYNPNQPLLGKKWWQGFSKRNEALVKKCVGKKFARNRAEHCTYDALLKMYKRVFDAFVESGNAIKLEEVEHVDKDGTRVEDVSAGFGYPASIKFTRPHNIFFLDETGANSGGRSDKNNAGEKLVCPSGCIPRQQVGIKDQHFTVTPVTNFKGELEFLVVIYKGKEVRVSWCLGLDVFAKEEGFGLGKRYPGGSSISVNGKEVPILFAASENASMNESILADLFQRMDEFGITERDEAEEVRPCALVDGHVSRLGLEFLSYINGVDSLEST